MFVIVECVNREIVAEVNDSKEEAWKIMLNCLLTTNNGEFREDYLKYKDENGFVEDADDYGINGDTAWANADGNDMECDWKIIEIEDKPYILVSVTDREICAESYLDKNLVWEMMLEELLSTNASEFMEAYDEDKDENGCVEESFDYGVSKDSAWANADGGDMDCDWVIFETAEI